MEKQKLIPIHLQGLHRVEFGQFLSRFFEDFQKTSLDESTDSDFKMLFDELKAKTPTYNKALERVRANEESKKIAELDKIRDLDVIALKDSIKPYRNAKTDAQKEAYNALKIVLDTHKNISKETYEKQTNRINILISTLKADKYPSHIANLKIEYFVNELEKSNKEFNDVFANRSFQNLQKESFDVKSLRKELTDIYRKLCNYVHTLADIKQDEFYKKTLDVINNSRKYYSDMLSIRAGKNSKEKTETPKDTV